MAVDGPGKGNAWKPARGLQAQEGRPDLVETGLRAVVDGSPRYQRREHGLIRDVLARRLGVWWASLELPGGKLSELR